MRYYFPVKDGNVISCLIHSTRCAMYALLCLLLISCESKPNAVYELLTFRTEVKEHCAEYTPEDWDSALNRYYEICQRLDEMPLTDEERYEIDKIKGEIAGYAATVAVEDAADEIINAVNEVGSFVEGFSKTFRLPKTQR